MAYSRKRYASDVLLPSYHLHVIGASLNIAESCFRGRDLDGIAIMCGKEGQPGCIQQLTLREQKFQTYQCAAGLRKIGFQPGKQLSAFHSKLVDCSVGMHCPPSAPLLIFVRIAQR